MEMANAGVGLGDALMLAKQGSNGNEMWNNPLYTLSSQLPLVVALVVSVVGVVMVLLSKVL